MTPHPKEMPGQFVTDMTAEEKEQMRDLHERQYKLAILLSGLNRMEMRRVNVLKMFLKATTAIVGVRLT